MGDKSRVGVGYGTIQNPMIGQEGGGGTFIAIYMSDRPVDIKFISFDPPQIGISIIAGEVSKTENSWHIQSFQGDGSLEKSLSLNFMSKQRF